MNRVDKDKLLKWAKTELRAESKVLSRMLVQEIESGTFDIREDRLNEIIDFFELDEGYDRDELIIDILSNIPSVEGIIPDEISLEWNGKYRTDLKSFIDEFYLIFISKVCNVLRSFKEEGHEAN